jgi:glucose/arabinose dehydrogenase
MNTVTEPGIRQVSARARRRGASPAMKFSMGVLLLALAVVGLGNAMAAIQVETVTPVTGSPVAITHAGDGSGRLFITLQEGRVMIFNGTLLPTPFLDISSLVSCCGERGLLSVAFHPNYATNGFFFVNYTNTLGNTVVARYQVSADPNVAASGSARFILGARQPFANHNGGQLQFGPDGYLYIGLGDGGAGGDPGNRAQNLGLLLGKILRINVDGALPYTIPPDNPFVGNPNARPEIWAYGLRNPWRFSFDRHTGHLFIGDVGQGAFEEVDFQLGNSLGGENYGWRLMEGKHCFNPARNCRNPSLKLPILEYSHTEGCAITGGYRYRGVQFPQLVGTYLFADFCNGQIWGATHAPGTGWTRTLQATTTARISTFGEDEAGEIYFAHRGGAATGAIFRISNYVP